MTTLATYIKDAGISQTAFARRLGISQSYLNEIANGRKTPSLPLAVKVAAATGGVVSVGSLIAVNTGSASCPTNIVTSD